MEINTIRNLDGSTRFHRVVIKRDDEIAYWNADLARLYLTKEVRLWIADNMPEAEVSYYRKSDEHTYSWKAFIVIETRNDTEAMFFQMTWG